MNMKNLIGKTPIRSSGVCVLLGRGVQEEGFRPLLKAWPLIRFYWRWGQDFKGGRFASPLPLPAPSVLLSFMALLSEAKPDPVRTQRTLFPPMRALPLSWRTQMPLFVPFCLPLLSFPQNKGFCVRKHGEKLTLFTISASIGRQRMFTIQTVLWLLMHVCQKNLYSLIKSQNRPRGRFHKAVSHAISDSILSRSCVGA